MASTGADYRYGYNGMEEEDRGDQVSAEIASTGEKPKPGEGNLLNTEYRLYDPRLAQWLTRDPVFQPWESPYSAMAGNPILFSDPQGDTPGTEHTPQAEAEGGGGGQKDKIVNYGPPNEKVDKYAKILAKHTSETPAYSQPDISICEPVNLVFRGNFLTVDNYDVVTKDGIVGSIGIGEFRWGERFALFHAERPEGVEVLQQIETGFNYNGIIITRQYSEAALLAHEPPVPSWLPSSSNQARINQPGQYNGKIPKTSAKQASAKQASPPPAAKQKTDQSAGSETLDDALRGTEQPFGGGAGGSPVTNFTLKDYNSFRGAKSEDVGKWLQQNGWVPRPTNKNRVYNDGTAYNRGNISDQIRIMTGGGTRSPVNKRGPYMEISIHGKRTVIELFGNPNLNK